MFPAASAFAAYNAAANFVSQPQPIDSGARTQAATLEMRLERQNLVIQTLLMILLEKKVIHEQEFKEWMLYVDELDGVRDGKLKEDKAPITCPKCQRKSPRSAVKCQYCGNEFSPEFLSRTPSTP